MARRQRGKLYAESNHHSQVLWTRGLLIRRNIANGDLANFTTWCPAGTSIKTLVSVEGHRLAIEDSFETAKNEFGSTTTNPDPGTAVIVTSRSSCSPSP
jgi:SRSO17 transposase